MIKTKELSFGFETLNLFGISILGFRILPN
jgi:hypothetical protein